MEEYGGKTYHITENNQCNKPKDDDNIIRKKRLMLLPTLPQEVMEKLHGGVHEWDI